MPNSNTPVKKQTMRNRLEMHASTGNVFKDIGYSDDEANNLLIRCKLMDEIEKIIKSNGWTQVQAAQILGVTQPRISEIMSDQVDLFTIDTLVKYINILGKEVSLTVIDKEVA